MSGPESLLEDRHCPKVESFGLVVLALEIENGREPAETQVEATISGLELLRLFQSGAQKLLGVGVARFVQRAVRRLHGIVPLEAVRGGRAQLKSQEGCRGEGDHAGLRVGHPRRLHHPRLAPFLAQPERGHGA